MMALLFGVVQLERVVVTVSSRLGRLVIPDRHILGRARYYAFPLDSIATAPAAPRALG